MGEQGREPDARAWATIEQLIRQSISENAPLAVDSSVLIAYLSDEPPIAGLIAPCLEHPAPEVVISMITLSEILVRAARGSARSHLNAIVSSVTTLPNVRFMDLNRDHAIEASIVRAETGLKFPDSAVIATARLANATALIGNDRAWIGRNLGVRYIHMDDLLDSLRSVGR